MTWYVLCIMFWRVADWTALMKDCFYYLYIY